MPLTASRRAILALLQEQTEPTGLASLVATSGLHPNTVREHLDQLVAAGLATRHAAAPSGRGRPAWLYAVAEEHSEYAGLAAALAASIHRTSADPWGDAVAAGTAWGAELAQERGATPGSTATQARREVVTLLDDLGFAPETGARASVVRLTRCPLLAAARKYPDVVCGVHLGIVRGALEEYGGEPYRTALHAFAEPGACLLRLRTEVEEP
ncbi:MAG TPA: helix-turn-helix domain-containing protein [Nocardioides sp.]|uniref:helix-turn-helix transcriptional regulator n=1 Tax=Nocardioides sp. TaxID=35761 RepID=UPI002C26DE0B|nr:helix-turn-helix domain-containing protein [Nocardioides sp.]HQR28040.1 helix-turn-helix domain-containing protein [Nocardioides sp.]